MREILSTCVLIDSTAARLYRDMAERCDDAAVSDVLGRMAVDETAHTAWWRELIDAHDAGLLPDLWDEPESMRDRFTETLDAVNSAVPAAGRLAGDDALAAAAAIELFLLDPAFMDLLQFAEPGAASERRDAYDRHVRRLVTAIEEHGSGGIERLLGMQLRRAWRENAAAGTSAMCDQLTGLPTRLALEAHLGHWSAWSARHGRPLSLLLIDVDRLRETNKKTGREAGDALVLAVADAVSSTVRSSDVPARYGSDEFAVLAPETGPEEARAMADRLAEAVRSTSITTSDAVLRPTVSIGIVVVVDPPDSDGRSVGDLTNAADHALYAAKQAGRDRVADPVVLATPL
jgi:diguanylate cyclase (GGDEF)-like protein